MLTVRELAESLGKSKPAIMKKIEELELRDQLTKEGNKLLIPTEVAETVRRSFEKRTEPTKTSKGDQQADIISMLSDTIAILEQQLAEKDKTINNLLEQLREKDKTIREKDKGDNEAIIEAIRAIQQGHYLVASTTVEQAETDQDREPTASRRGILGRLFK